MGVCVGARVGCVWGGSVCVGVRCGHVEGWGRVWGVCVGREW